MVAARLVTTVAAPLDPGSADAPEVLYTPGQRFLVQRGDTEVLAVGLDEDAGAALRPRIRFPAPWPRDLGSVTVSPTGDAAVFAGVHAVLCVEAGGSTRWEIRHHCWSECDLLHASFAEYADDEDHEYADGGSVAVSADGKLVWAHVRGPLADSTRPDDDEDEEDEELWVVLDAADGTVLGQARTGTVASGSHQIPPPDPAQMGLSVGEGEEGSPTLWGRWDGQRLSVRKIGDELILLSVSPSGRYLLTTDLGQDSLTLHEAESGSVLREVDARGAVPTHPASTGEGRVYWDLEAAFVDENTVIAGTSESEARYGAARHWLVNMDRTTSVNEISYPFPVSGPPRTAGDGIWYTLSADRASVHLWRLDES